MAAPPEVAAELQYGQRGVAFFLTGLGDAAQRIVDFYGHSVRVQAYQGQVIVHFVERMGGITVIDGRNPPYPKHVYIEKVQVRIIIGGA